LKRASDWIVVGGGIVGAACAYYLASDGHRVTLLERGDLASGTSGAGQNNIGVPLAADERTAYFQTAFAAYMELRDLGFEFDFQAHGHLYVALNPEVAKIATSAAEQLRVAGVSVRLLGRRDLAAAEPRLARTVEAAVLLPDGAQVSPLQTVHELATAATRLGARIVTGTEVTGVSLSHGQFTSVSTTRGRFDADGLVIAAGVWSRQLGTLAGLDVPVFPRKGHVLVTEPAPRWMSHGVMDFGFDLALMMGASKSSDAATVGAVIQPLPSGNIAVGGSYEDAGFDRAVEDMVVERITDEAARVMPDIRSLKILRRHAGLRPVSSDGWPLVGACSQIQGLMLATGHGSGGIDGGPIAGRLIADLVAGRRIGPELDALDPGRLGAALYFSGAQPPPTRVRSLEPG
jgi:glycine/D-amino acid oxidase-like deaminating enzyme